MTTLTIDRSIYLALNQPRRLEYQILALFLESRGRNAPSIFARTDIEALHIRTVTHSVEEPKTTRELHTLS